MQFDDFARGILVATKADPRHKSRMNYWISYFGDKEVLSITVDDVDRGIEVLAQRGKLAYKPDKGVTATGKPLSGATINRHLTSLAGVFKAGRKLKLLPKNHKSPTCGADKAVEEPGRIIHITKEQTDNIVAASRLVRWDKFPAMVCVAMTSGARKGNLRTLKWREVDLEKGVLFFHTSKNGRPYSAAISPRAVAELKKIKKPLHQPDDLVFGNYCIEKAWRRTLELAGVEYFCWHGLRHVAASALANSGASAITIMAQLNHSSMSMVRRYAHQNTDTLRENVSRAWG